MHGHTVHGHTTPHSAALSFDIIVPTVEPLTWGARVPPDRRRAYDLVVGSDVTYNKDAIQDLLRTLREVTTQGQGEGEEGEGDNGDDDGGVQRCGAAEVYVGHLERGDEPEFFEALDRDLGFAVREVHKEVRGCFGGMILLCCGVHSSVRRRCNGKHTHTHTHAGRGGGRHCAPAHRPCLPRAASGKGARGRGGDIM